MPLASRKEQLPVSPSEAAQSRSAPGKVTGRLLIAMRAMVWDGLKRAEAAAKANLTEHSLYVALRRPHVRAWYLNEIEVLRTSERSRNIHRLTQIRDAADNMPAVQAIKMLEQLGDDDVRSNAAASHSPGVTIVIRTAAPDQPTIDVTPNARDICTE